MPIDVTADNWLIPALSMVRDIKGRLTVPKNPANTIVRYKKDTIASRFLNDVIALTALRLSSKECLKDATSNLTW
jgi:hypothetical protein